MRHASCTYVISVGAVIPVGFLLMTSLLMTAALSAFANAIPWFQGALQPIGSFISFAVIALLFAAMFKYMPDAAMKCLACETELTSVIVPAAPPYLVGRCPLCGRLDWSAAARADTHIRRHVAFASAALEDAPSIGTKDGAGGLLSGQARRDS